MSTAQMFTREHIIPQLVVWFNALPDNQRIIRPTDVPFFNVKVIQDPSEPSLSNIVIGDQSIAIDPTLVLGEATFTWSGSRHLNLPQTADDADFYEVAKNVAMLNLQESTGAIHIGAADGLTVQANLDSLLSSIDATITDLANYTDPLKGAGMVGSATVNLQSLSDLQLFPGRRNGDTVSIVSVESDWELNEAYPFPSGGGEFVWDASSTETAIYGMLVQVTGIITGRWKRKYEGPVHVTWTGAIPDGLTHCSAAVQLAADNYTAVYFPPGKFVLDNYTTHTLIYTPTVLTCGVKLTTAQKCKELFGAGEATVLLGEPGVRYNALISQYNVTDVSVHSFNMDGLYDRSSSAFLGALIGIRQQSIRRCTTHSIKASHFTYHCLAMYGGSDVVTEPACLWNKAYDLYLDDGGQSSLLVYSSTYTGLVLPNEFNEFTDIFGMNSHVYFGVEVRKSNNNTFNNLITNSNTKGGLNFEEGASNNKVTNWVSKYNYYGLHLTGNGVENVVGNRISNFDCSQNTSHNVLAYQGAVGNYLTHGRLCNSVGGYAWYSADTSSTGNYLIDVDVQDNFGEGLLFQAAENLTDVRITGNGLRGVTVFGAAKLRRVTSRSNGTNITSVAGTVVNAIDCDFGPTHAVITKDAIRTGQFIEACRAGRYASGGANVTEEVIAGSLSEKVWKTSTQYNPLISIPSGLFFGSGFTSLKVMMRVQTDGGTSRLLRDINGATNITIPANTGWIWVTYTLALAGLTAASVLNIRYETATGYVLMDGYQLALV